MKYLMFDHDMFLNDVIILNEKTKYKIVYENDTLYKLENGICIDKECKEMTVLEDE